MSFINLKIGKEENNAKKKKILIFIFLIILICVLAPIRLIDKYNIFMAEPNWGLLEKSQVDDETIEEAIDRLIAAHDDDADSHIGAGKSLDTHKDQETIDHPAGSVLADKDSMTELIIKDDLKSLTGWTQIGSIDETDWPGCKFYVEWGAVNESSMYTQAVMPAAFFNTNKNMTFQASMYFDGSNALWEGWLGIAIDDILPSDGFGFIFEDGVTKAVFAIGSTRSFSSAITNDETVEHVYRAYYNATTQEAKFYIDGVLKATISKPTGTGSLDLGGSVGIKITEENDGNMVIGPVTMAIEI